MHLQRFFCFEAQPPRSLQGWIVSYQRPQAANRHLKQLISMFMQELPVAQQVVTEMPLLVPGETCSSCTSHTPHTHAPSPPQPSVLDSALNKLKTDLRDVYVAPPVMEQFLRYAQRNTSQGIEFCGILAGAFFSIFFRILEYFQFSSKIGL
jgi:hypothetical protein